MISKTFNRYIWLLNTLIQHKQLTFDEISRLWKDSGLDDGKGLALRTFHVHRDAIKELFGVEIKCSTSSYKYYIASLEQLRRDRTRNWLLNSFTISNMIEAGHNMHDRILFEDIPRGTEFLQTVIEAMQQNKELIIDYQSFDIDARRRELHMQPYAMKVYHQRWYIVGFIHEDEAIRNIALDRASDIVISDKKFNIPKDFDAKDYYANTVGIFVNDELAPQNVTIRVYGHQMNYLKTLPLHHSQEIIYWKTDEYADLEYKLCLTPELTTQLLSMGESVEVLEPLELRQKMLNRLENAIGRYKK
ncbi:MAG: WYL domain-containing protein [Muribaculum sp.]|nr:WYL domain-containing protein [Muribaculum sp.]